MWQNFHTSSGSNGPFSGLYKTQMRDFGFFSNVNVTPGKSFKNPNFVNSQHPNKHSITYMSPLIRQNYCQKSDLFNNVTEKFKIGNFSQNGTEQEPVKENLCENPIKKSTVESSTDCKIVCQKSDTFSSPTENPKTNCSENSVEAESTKGHTSESSIKKYPEESSLMCYSRKRCKKIRRNSSVKVPNKNSKQNNSRRQISDMMEIDLEPDISMNGCDTNTNCVSPKSFHLTDFMMNIADFPNKTNKTDDEFYTFVSISPPTNKNCLRDRELSICESEDSFIVFDSGTDEELKFSDSDNNTDLESEDDDFDSDIDDDFDSSYSVVPCKRVRFADEEDLCEIHPMVQWSFAYRRARKGPWEEYARDRERFNKRIMETGQILAPVFNQRHRENVYKERFDQSVP